MSTNGVRTCDDCRRSPTVVDDDVDYRLFDADEHYYEPEDWLTRHLDRKYRSAVRWADMDGRASRHHRRQALQSSQPDLRPGRAPGSLDRYFRAQNPDARSCAHVSRSPSSPSTATASARAGARRAGRRVRLDPPEPRARHRGDAERRPRAAWRSSRPTTCGSTTTGGTTATVASRPRPMISLMDPDAAETELDRVIAGGARLVVMRAGPVAVGTATALARRSRPRPRVGPGGRSRRGGRIPCRRRWLHQVHGRLGGERRYTGLKHAVHRGVVGPQRASDLRHDGGDGVPRRVRPAPD